MKHFINGRFLSQKLTGVQRYAAELVKAIDALLASDQSPAALKGAEWQLLVPSETSEAIKLTRIKVHKIGRLSGHAWDQIELARAAAGGRLISLANAGPVFHRDHIVVIHDAQVFRRPDFFNWRYLAVHRTMGCLLARRATIATVSAFSRNELAAMLGLSKTDIPIFPTAQSISKSTTPDPSWKQQRRMARPGRLCLPDALEAGIARQRTHLRALRLDGRGEPAAADRVGVFARLRAIPARRPATGSSWPSISQRCHDCAQRRRVNCARDPHPSPGRELNLDRTAASGGRSQRSPVGRNGHCRKTDFAILPLHRLRAARPPVRACPRQAVTRLR
ncbi:MULTISPECIES: hypothetical protein [Bradyrhizobium]|uniref:hypothetical protein n=1 Tax=unclassified Bradyrhizobium TaxID=2631580 RepID=UPI001FD9AA80|nr:MULTISPECIES: hypothetical protein [Bradyrhizobium]